MPKQNKSKTKRDLWIKLNGQNIRVRLSFKAKTKDKDKEEDPDLVNQVVAALTMRDCLEDKKYY